MVSKGIGSAFVEGMAGGCGCLMSLLGFVVSVAVTIGVFVWYQTGQNPIEWFTAANNGSASEAEARAKFARDVRDAYSPLERSYTHLFINTLNPYYQQKEADRDHVHKAYTEFKDSVAKAKAFKESLAKPPDKDCEVLATAFANYVDVLGKGADEFSSLVRRIETERFERRLAVDVTSAYQEFDWKQKQARLAYLLAADVFDKR